AISGCRGRRSDGPACLRPVGLFPGRLLPRPAVRLGSVVRSGTCGGGVSARSRRRTSGAGAGGRGLVGGTGGRGGKLHDLDRHPSRCIVFLVPDRIRRWPLSPGTLARRPGPPAPLGTVRSPMDEPPAGGARGRIADSRLASAHCLATCVSPRMGNRGRDDLVPAQPPSPTPASAAAQSRPGT